MQLNPDCIRDLLIVIEDNTNYKIGVTYPSEHFSHLLNKYSDMMLRYHLIQLSKANRIEPIKIDDLERLTITDLTPMGHEFLANIRSDTVWNKTKPILKILGTHSISIINQVAGNVLTYLINTHLT